MLATAARNLSGFARSAASRASRAKHDAQALGELAARPLELPAGLEIEWLGVSGYRLSYEGRTLVIDPYFSRISLRDFVLRKPAWPDPALTDRYLESPGEVVGVLVGHTHFDHAVDAPAIAKRLRCKAYGSRSLVNLMALHGLATQAVEVTPYEPYELGPFVVSFVPSAHSKLLLGLKVPMDGELTCDHLGGLCGNAYRCGQVFGIHIEVAGMTFYHQGSADLIDDAIRHRGIDVFLAGIAGRSVTPRYWERILPLLDPAVVVPTHYDDFFEPLEAGRAGSFSTMNCDIAAVPDELAHVSRDLQVAALPRMSGR